MKNARFFNLAYVVPLFCFSWSVRAADGPADLSATYFQAYLLQHQATKLVQASKPDTAVAKFKSAREILDRLRTTQPDWKPEMVQFRLTRIDDALEGLGVKADATQPQ